MRDRRRQLLCALGGTIGLSGCLDLQSDSATPAADGSTDTSEVTPTTPTETPRPINLDTNVTVPETLSNGRELQVVAEIQNDGREVSGTVHLAVDGEERDTRTLSLLADESIRLYLFADDLDVGTHDLRLRFTYENGGEQRLARATTEVVPGTFTIQWSGATVPAQDVEGNDDTRHLSFGCQRFVVAAGNEFLTDIDVGTTEDRGLFVEGAHQRETGGDGTFRWLGAPDDETVITSEADLREADEVWLDGYTPPESTGRTATFVFDGTEYETVSVPQDGVLKLLVPEFD